MHLITSGTDVPNNFNTIIEIPAQSNPIKYEVNKETGAIFVDRFMATAMHYPCNYGYIPNTLSEDGDPADVLVITPFPVISGSVVRCRPIGLLRMTDESGKDAKILAVPISKLTVLYDRIQSPQDFSPLVTDQIEHFFKHYKDLEKDKWVKVDGWEDKNSAEKEILDSINRYNNQK